MGQAAAAHCACELRAILDRQTPPNILVATGARHFQTLTHPVKESGIAWTTLSVFHLKSSSGLP